MRVEVRDDEGDVTARTVPNVSPTTDNQSPSVWLDAPPKAGTNVPVELDAYAFDVDGTIAQYSLELR